MLRAYVQSNVHNFEVTWTQLMGEIVVDPARVSDGIEGAIEVNMQGFEAGDWLRNRKLRSDLDVAHHPTARLDQLEIGAVEKAQGNRANGFARARLRWRGCETVVVLDGSIESAPPLLKASCEFHVRIQDFDISPPRFLMFRIADEVRITASVCAYQTDS